MTTPTIQKTTPSFTLHSARGPFNAAFFAIMGPYIESSLRTRKEWIFDGLPERVVELGSGVGPNLRYLKPGSELTVIEPNTYMHPRLAKAARRRGIHLDLRETMAEETGLADHSVDAVISSLVLCSVEDPVQVLAEIRRILRPGGTYRFAEHVAAQPGTLTRLAQRLFRRPWAWTFEGCSCERDLERLIRDAGFVSVTVERFRLHSPFVPFNTHIAGIARA
jgi:ubiquinone/menaquinone biosynthesis C-methylase UbiE